MTQKQIENYKLEEEFKLCFSKELVIKLSKQEPAISLIMKNKKVSLTTCEWRVLSQSLDGALNFYLDQKILMYPKHGCSNV